jgi:hypothetical protein
MPDQLFPQWRNANDHDKYPFNLLASLTNGSLFIPENLFSDARLYPIGGTAGQYLSKVVKTPETITIYVSDLETLDLASTSYQIAATPSGVLKLEDPYGRAAGVFVTDAVRLGVFLGWPDGEHEFDQDQTLFASAVVTPMPQLGIRSIRVDENEVLADDAYLVGGHGIQLEVDDTDPANPIITASAVGEPQFKKILCAETGFFNPCLLKTINGIPPDEYGNFTIIVCNVDTDNTVIRIEPTQNGLRIFAVGGVVTG